MNQEELIEEIKKRASMMKASNVEEKVEEIEWAIGELKKLFY